MMRIAFGLVYIGLCLGELHFMLHIFAPFTRDDNIADTVWLHHHDLRR